MSKEPPIEVRIKNTIIQYVERNMLEQEECILNLAEWQINMQEVDLGEQFMEEVCTEIEKLGFNVKFCLFMSFIWRHKLIISRAPITEFLPHFEGHKVSYFRNEHDKAEFKNRADGFIKAFHYQQKQT